MLYRIVGEEVATRRHVEIPNWDAPDIAAANRFATEIGVAVSRIEPMYAPRTVVQECKGDEPDALSPITVAPDAPQSETTPTSRPPSLAAIIVAIVCLLASIAVVITAINTCMESRNSSHPSEMMTWPTSTVGTSAIDETLPSELKRREIFLNLVAVQDAGVGDAEAFTLMARKYGVPKDALYRIAYEGAAKGWPMP
ncbi:MAG: hypothetical protein LLG00_11130 [Planctomycetaceae bacterium]|nr:hypothetical protein [Planctomycetaceae bacterium]